MTIDELITFCEEEEHGCRVRCKRYDDASGFTRSKDKNVRTADAITEEVYGDFYKEISETMRKYQNQERVLDKIRAEIDNALSDGMIHKKTVIGIIDKYKGESEGEEPEI